MMWLALAMPLVLPSQVEPGSWTTALGETDFEISRTPSCPGAVLIAKSATQWDVQVCDKHGHRRSATIDAPTTESDRQEALSLATSLLRPSQSATFELAPPLDKAPKGKAKAKAKPKVAEEVPVRLPTDATSATSIPQRPDANPERTAAAPRDPRPIHHGDGQSKPGDTATSLAVGQPDETPGNPDAPAATPGWLRVGVSGSWTPVEYPVASADVAAGIDLRADIELGVLISIRSGTRQLQAENWHWTARFGLGNWWWFRRQWALRTSASVSFRQYLSPSGPVALRVLPEVAVGFAWRSLTKTRIEPWFEIATDFETKPYNSDVLRVPVTATVGVQFCIR